MQDIAHIPTWAVECFGLHLVFNSETLLMSWLVMMIILVFGYAATKHMALVPGALQNASEILVVQFRALIRDSLGRLGPRYFAFLVTLFAFILVSNWLGMIPFLSEPTKDLNTTLILGIIGFFVAHYTAIRVKGWKSYLKQYVQPFAFMLPLNIIGELAKIVSISFRLYGNVMGGAIIILVVSTLVRQWLLPPFLCLFFGAFVGSVQAFVFAMLTLTYISVAIEE